MTIEGPSGRVHEGALSAEPWDVFLTRLDDWQIAVVERFINDPTEHPCDVKGDGLQGRAAYWQTGGPDGIATPTKTDADFLRDARDQIRRRSA